MRKVGPRGEMPDRFVRQRSRKALTVVSEGREGKMKRRNGLQALKQDEGAKTQKLRPVIEDKS